jgi:hypothetical protein
MCEDQYPIPAPQHSFNLILVTLGQEFDAHSRIILNLFGSGYAGLGYCARVIGSESRTDHDGAPIARIASN